jgi:hypothetical protein
MILCDLCHEDADAAHWWRQMRLCRSCIEGVEYEALMTPAERKADHEAAARFVDESQHECQW